MNFNYVFMPAVILVTAALIAWLCSRQLLALSNQSARSWQTRTKQALLAIVLLAVVLIAGSTLFNAIAVHRFWSRHPAPGQIVDVDGYKMHIDCMGNGSPTLILEAGGQNDSTIWNEVQPALAKTTRVCSYDRAGFGWSDSRPNPRDADHIAAELHQLLLRAGIDGPIVLMGHSIAGLYLRDYVTHYPVGVSGLILIDSSTPFQQWNPVVVRAFGPPSSGPPAWMWNVALIVGTPRLLGMCKGASGPDAALNKVRAEEICRLRTAAFSELENFDRSSGQAIYSRSFGALPILIFSRDTSKSLPGKTTQAEIDASNAWSQMQEDLKFLSSRSRRIIARNSSHYVMGDRLDLILKEVPAFIEQIQGSAPPPVTYGSTETE